MAAAPRVRTRYYKGYLVGLRLEDVVGRIPADATLVGITVIFTHEWPAVVRLIELIKAARPGLPVVLGGEHVTSMPECSMQTSGADFLVLGEGEEVVVELARALGDGGELGAIDGLVWRRGAVVRLNRRRARRAEVDAIAPPAWDHFDLPAYHRHRYMGGMHSPHLTVPILATRGCPYQCTYCSSPNMWTPRWLPRDRGAVVDEIEGYVRRYGARNFPFQDLTAIIQKDWIVRFCREILDRGIDITWQLPTGTRSEAIDREVAGLLRRSGMINMAYAPESGSETTRRLIKKKMKTDRLFDSLEAAAEAELNVAIFLVIGFPHDRPEHLRENFAFIDRLAEIGVTDTSIGFYMALPGTELFHSLYDAGRITLDRAYFRHILDSLNLVASQSYCEQLSRLDLFRWKLRMYFRFYNAKRRRAGRAGVVRSLARAVSGIFSAAHTSRLQSAFSNALASARDSAVVRLQPGWLPEAEERAMFEGWDAAYRETRRRNIAAGIAAPAPADTSRLHEANVVAALRREHTTPRTVAV